MNDLAERTGYVLEEANIADSQRLSIRELEESKAREVWVVNTAPIENGGVIQFQVNSESGNALGIEVPYTYVAINLADQISPEALLRSDIFRKVIARGFLTIVTPEYAKANNANPEAQVELANINKGVVVGVAETAMAINNGIEANRNIAGLSQDANIFNTNSSGFKRESDPKYKVNSLIASIVNNNSLTEDARLNSIRANKKLLKLSDAIFIKRAGVAEDEQRIVKASNIMIEHLTAKETKGMSDKEAEAHLNNCRMAARTALRSA